MRTSCKSCQNWIATAGERGWCANFEREVANSATCGEWRVRKTADSGQALADGDHLSGSAR